MNPPPDLELYALPELYDEQYARYQGDLAFYRRLAEDCGGPVLELGAGTGRVTAALARAGVKVTALELSPAMLERARARPGLEGVTFLQGDMRELDLDERFALVVAPFNTLMHAYTAADQDRTLAAARRHLDGGGVFACDLYAPPSVHGSAGLMGVLRREAEWAGVGGDRAELFVLQEHDPARQLLTSRYYLDETGVDGALTRRRAVLRQRYYTRFELERALAQAGFARASIYGDFDKRPYDLGAAHLVAVARV